MAVVVATVALVEAVVAGQAVVAVVVGHLGKEVLEEMAAAAVEAVATVAAVPLVSYIYLESHSLIFLIHARQIISFTTRVFVIKAINVIKKLVTHRSGLIF